jgi:hypothetical protein
VVAAPSPVTSVVDSGSRVVDTRSPEVEREECVSGWSDTGRGGNSIGARRFLAEAGGNTESEGGGGSDSVARGRRRGVTPKNSKFWNVTKIH